MPTADLAEAVNQKKKKVPWNDWSVAPNGIFVNIQLIFLLLFLTYLYYSQSGKNLQKSIQVMVSQ